MYSFYRSQACAESCQRRSHPNKDLVSILYHTHPLIDVLSLTINYFHDHQSKRIIEHEENDSILQIAELFGRENDFVTTPNELLPTLRKAVVFKQQYKTLVA